MVCAELHARRSDADVGLQVATEIRVVGRGILNRHVGREVHRVERVARGQRRRQPAAGHLRIELSANVPDSNSARWGATRVDGEQAGQEHAGDVHGRREIGTIVAHDGGEGGGLQQVREEVGHELRDLRDDGAGRAWPKHVDDDGGAAHLIAAVLHENGRAQAGVVGVAPAVRGGGVESAVAAERERGAERGVHLVRLLRVAPNGPPCAARA